MSERHTVRALHNQSVIQSIYTKSNKTCPICGDFVDLRLQRGKHWNIDHVIPVAVLKWCPNLTKAEYWKLYHLISGHKNSLITHYSCNLFKTCKIDDTTIGNLHLPKGMRQSILELYEEAKPFIERYNKLLDEVIAANGAKCCVCGTSIHERPWSIRRMDRNKERTVDNACIVCAYCTERFWKFRKKHKN